MEIEFVADPIDNNQNNEAADGDANNDQIPEAPPVERFALPLTIVIEWKDQANDNYFASNNASCDGDGYRPVVFVSTLLYR